MIINVPIKFEFQDVKNVLLPVSSDMGLYSIMQVINLIWAIRKTHIS